jgi:mono/diheme cytochrome c family protein
MAGLTACGLPKQVELKPGQSGVNLTSTAVTRGSDVVYPSDRPSVADGALVYKQQNCASCHSGGDTKAPNFADKNYARNAKPTEQFRIVYFGNGANHPKLQGQRSDREAWDAVFYARSLADPPLTDKEITDINLVFQSNCGVCHGAKGNGDGPLAHNLEPSPANFASYPRFYDRSDAVLWDHIANGIKWEGMPNFLGKEDKAKNVKFDEAYIWKLVAFVRHFQETTEPTLAANPPDKGQKGDNNEMGTKSQ